MGSHIPSPDAQRGFTLVEMLVVIALIVGTSGVLVPVFLNARLISNHDAAKQWLSSIFPCVEAFRNSTGRLPADLLEIDPDCLDLAGLTTPIQQGYEFSIDAAAGVPWTMKAKPAEPGLTGMLAFVLDASGNLSEFSISEADEVRQKVLDGLFVAGARAAGDLLRLDLGDEAIPRIRNFAADSTTQLQILQQFDANANGGLEFGELFAFVPDGDAALVGPYLRLRELLVTGLKPGAGNEGVLLMLPLPLLDLLEQIGLTSLIFEYAPLCRLTRLLVQSSTDSSADDVADSLCDHLAAAQRAEARGNERAKRRLLAAFQKVLTAHTGTALTEPDASLLSLLVRTL